MLEDVNQTQAAFMAILDKTDDATLYKPAEYEEDGWSLAEVLVHMAEAREYFAKEVRKVLASPGVAMGRTVEHPDRIRNVKEHGGDSKEAIYQWLVASHQTLVDLLEEMKEESLQSSGVHVKFGEQTLAEFIQRFVVEHDAAHVRQARQIVP